ncbi:hypothetical protein KJ885_05165 [Patescibacteria group bacterium]|nr:hypothetical protein [Patescibacteria group bacterium]
MLKRLLEGIQHWRLIRTTRDIAEIKNLLDTIDDQSWQKDAQRWLKRANKRKKELERKLGI